MKSTRRRWGLIGALWMVGGCGLMDAPASVEEEPLVFPWESEEVQPTLPVEPVQPTRPVEPTQPVEPAPVVVPEGCGEPSQLSAARLDDAAHVPGPTITERFDAAGCVADRHTFTYDRAGYLVEQTYAFFLPELQFQTYMQLVAFRQRTTYDAQGRITHILKTHLDTGELLYEEDTRYDADGRKTRQLRDHHDINFPSEGVSEERWSYHDSGELLNRELYYNGELIDAERFERDAAGRPLRRFTTVFRQNLGMIEALAERWEYDDASRVVVHMTQDARGVALTISSSTYREDGTLLSREEANNAQGWLDIWRYDEQGRELLHTQDENRDGIVDYMQETVFDARGERLLERTSYNADGRGGFRSNSETTRVFDAQGRILEERGVSVNERRMWSTNTSWIWDQGSAQRTSTYRDSDTPATITSRARVLPDERLLWITYYDQTGAATLTIDYTYDAAGRTLREVRQNGEQRSALVYTYDVAGRLVSRATSGANFEGDPTVRAEWRYR